MAEYYRKKQPSCTLPDGTEWFAGAAGDSCTSRVFTQVPIVAKNPTATNSEYIEREAAERILESVGAPAYAIHALALVKTADVVPVVRGEWGELDYDFDEDKYTKPCSNCGYKSTEYLKSYCPNCGADMRERKDGDTDG